MADPHDDLASALRRYRQTRWTLLGHGVFVVACCAVVVLLRRLFRLPPALLGTVLVVALLVFGADIMKFFRARDRLRELENENSR